MSPFAVNFRCFGALYGRMLAEARLGTRSVAVKVKSTWGPKGLIINHSISSTFQF